MMENEKITVEMLEYRYPQLTLPITAGQSQTDAYRDIVQKGQMPQTGNHNLSGAAGTGMETVQTAAGEAEVLYLPNRRDFVFFLQAIAYRCEPVQIPETTGAMTIRNINNWRKIEAHKAKYLSSGNFDWQAEFKRFTAEPENYRDTVIVITDGPYSALSSEDTPYSPEAWNEVSRKLRKYHELAHFVSGRLYKENRDALRDEVMADCVGILAATGAYDTALAKKFLGTETNVYRTGGRLQNYAKSAEETERFAKRANAIIEGLTARLNSANACDPLKFLEEAEKEKLFIQAEF